MGYLSSHRGDYLGSYRGDPGFFKKLLKGVGKVAGMFLGGGAAPQPQIIQQYLPAQAFPGGMSLVPPGTRKIPARLPRVLGTGGAFSRTPGQIAAGVALGAAPRRKRMNVANPKALRRAIRRQAGFVKLAKRSLKGSGYTVVSKGSGRRRSPSVIVESGPGSVVSR